jgi:hypothetical protein
VIGVSCFAEAKGALNASSAQTNIIAMHREKVRVIFPIFVLLRVQGFRRLEGQEADLVRVAQNKKTGRAYCPSRFPFFCQFSVNHLATRKCRAA